MGGEDGSDAEACANAPRVVCPSPSALWLIILALSQASSSWPRLVSASTPLLSLQTSSQASQASQRLVNSLWPSPSLATPRLSDVHPCRPAPSSPLDVFVGGSGVGCALFALHFLFCTPTTTYCYLRGHTDGLAGCGWDVHARYVFDRLGRARSRCVLHVSSHRPRSSTVTNAGVPPQDIVIGVQSMANPLSTSAPRTGQRHPGTWYLDRRWSLRSSLRSALGSFLRTHASTHRCWPCPIEPSSRVAWQSVKAAVRETHPCVDGAPCLASLPLSTVRRRGYLRRTRLDIR